MRTETFNDDVYEYDTVGIPFLRDLGRAVHAYRTESENARIHRAPLDAVAFRLQAGAVAGTRICCRGGSRSIVGLLSAN